MVGAVGGRGPTEPAPVAQRGVEGPRVLIAPLLDESGERRIELFDQRHEIDHRLGRHPGTAVEPM